VPAGDEAIAQQSQIGGDGVTVHQTLFPRILILFYDRIINYKNLLNAADKTSAILFYS